LIAVDAPQGGVDMPAASNFNATCPKCKAHFSIDLTLRCPACGYKLKCGEEITKHVTPEAIKRLNAEANQRYNPKPPAGKHVCDMSDDEIFAKFGRTRQDMLRENWNRLAELTRLRNRKSTPAIEKEISDRWDVHNSLRDSGTDY
jgi:uncharacterized Zn finger protein (UPF0148 family)